MGYRLNIDFLQCDDIPYTYKELYYGTKLYGYNLDLEDSLSYDYLKTLGLFNGNEYFDYSFKNLVALNYKQLKIFLELYNIDYNKYGFMIEEQDKDCFKNDETIKNLLDDEVKWEDENFIIYWS